jgi:protocatechuate 3,4-dioxygenase beta subunit
MDKEKNRPSLEKLLTETPAVEEGPYYKKGSPARTSLIETGIPGQKIVLSGSVLDTHGRPVPHAWLDFWQADGRGEYDNQGFTLRGHQFTNASGKYLLETVLPGSYPGRTPHIHVKVKADDKSPVLTVQLFIPGIASNKTDFLYKEELLIKIEERPEGQTASFDFVVVTGLSD